MSTIDIRKKMSRLSNENTDIPEVMISNRRFHVRWNASVSHNESECLRFKSRCTNVLSQSTDREKISTSVAIFDVNVPAA